MSGSPTSLDNEIRFAASGRVSLIAFNLLALSESYIGFTGKFFIKLNTKTVGTKPSRKTISLTFFITSKRVWKFGGNSWVCELDLVLELMQVSIVPFPAARSNLALDTRSLY